VIVRFFVNIGGIVSHNCLSFLFIVVGLLLYKIKHNILFYRKTFNPHCYNRNRRCWRTEPHYYMLCIKLLGCYWNNMDQNNSSR